MGRKNRPNGPRIASIAIIVVAAVLIAATGVAVSQLDGFDEDTEPADEIIVEDDQVILIYEEEQTDDEFSSLELGGDAGTGIGYANFESDETETNGTGSFSAELTQTALTMQGSGEFERPENLQDFSTVLEYVQSDSENNLNLEIDAVSAEPAPGTATSTGEIVTEADRFQLTTEFNIESALLRGQGDSSLNLDVSETSNGFVVDVQQVQTGRDLSRQETEQAFKNQIQGQANAFARQAGGSATVTVDSHSYQSGEQRDRLEVDYTIEMTNVRDGFATMAADQMQAEDDLTQAQRDAIEQLLADTSIDTFSIDVESSGSTAQGDITIEVSNFKAGTVALLQAIEEDDEIAPAQDFEDIQAQFEAQEAADLRQVVTWNVEVSQQQGGTGVSVDVESDAENWGAYVEEANSRGIRQGNPQTDLTFESQTEGDTITADLDFQSENEQLVEQTLNQSIETIEQQPDTTEDAEEAVQFLESLQAAQFNKAKTNITVDDGVEMEAGIYFEESSVVQTGIEENVGVPVSHVYATGEGSTATSYVYIDASGMSEDEIRESPVADEETEFVSRDDRDPQRLDIDAAASYLGVDVQQAGADSEEDGGLDGLGPGFGVVAALVAVLSGTLYLRRQA